MIWKRKLAVTLVAVLTLGTLVTQSTDGVDAASTSYLNTILVKARDGSVLEDRFMNYDFNPGKDGKPKDYWAKYHDADHVDWGVSMVFWNAGNKDWVKAIYRALGVSQDGSAAYGSLNDGGSWQTQSDKGVKTSCPIAGRSRHMRLYANGGTPSMYNRAWGYYVLGTTHRDVNECSKFWAWFGESEEAEEWFTQQWTAVYSGPNIVRADAFRMYNRQGWPTPRRIGDHEWHQNGYATTLYVPKH